MLAVSVPFLYAFLITYFVIFFDFAIVNGKEDSDSRKCDKLKKYKVLSNAIKLNVALFYDAGKDLEPDISFLNAMCYSANVFKEFNFAFLVGVRVKVHNNGSMECPNSDKKNKNCKNDIEHVCASELVYAKAFVCCTVNRKSPEQCVADLDDSKVDEFKQCVQLRHNRIRPDQIFLKNQAAAKNIDPDLNGPILAFNSKKADECARITFISDPIKVICALLAKGVSKSCPN